VHTSRLHVILEFNAFEFICITCSQTVCCICMHASMEKDNTPLGDDGDLMVSDALSTLKPSGKNTMLKIDPYTQSKTQSNQKHTENFMREFGGVSWFEICQSGTKFTCLERKNTILLSVFFFLEHQLLWELDFYTTLVKGQNFPLCLCNFCKFPPEIRKVGEKYKEMEVILPNSDRKMTRNMLNYSIRTKKNVHGRFSVG